MVKELTGLQINHVVNVDFHGFVRAVDAIGCVYVDVDRHYYHDNVGVRRPTVRRDQHPAPATSASAARTRSHYVRYRHTDTDLVRAARQQDFLRDARQQVPVSDPILGRQRSELIDIFTKYTTSDISDADTDDRACCKLFLAVARRADQRDPLPGRTRARATSTRAQPAIHRRGRPVPRHRGHAGPARLARSDRSKQAARHEAARSKEQQEATASQRRTARPRRPRCRPRDRQAARRSSSARKVGAGFPVFYPTRRAPGAAYVETDRYVHIQDPRVVRPQGHRRQDARRLPDASSAAAAGSRLLRRPGDRAGRDPPILERPDRDPNTIDGRDYDIYFDGDRVRLVAWHDAATTPTGSPTTSSRPSTNDQMLGDGALRDVDRPEAEAEAVEGQSAMSDSEPVGVVGVGWVGLVTAACFAELGHQVSPATSSTTKVEALARGEVPIHEPGLDELLDAQRRAARLHDRCDELLDNARLLFCCVDTPPTYSGDADLSRVQPVVEQLRADGEHALVMKSTVPSGTGAAIRRDLARARLRLLPGVPQGGLGGRGLPAPRPRRDRRRPRRRVGRRRRRGRSTSRSAARWSAPTSPAPR